MKSPPDRIDKIRALLHSPVEGEREAAQAALDRMKPPAAGTPERADAVREWNRKIDWAISRLGTPGLSAAEVRTIRNLFRHRGDPWSRGADAFMAVYRKLRSGEESGLALAHDETPDCAM